MSKPVEDSMIRHLVEKYHTPLFIFSESVIRSQCQQLKAAISYENKQIRYACKALTLQEILKIVLSEGINIDAVSINEVKRAQRAGFNTDQILYTGEGASPLVFEELLEKGILINCSSIDQLRLIGQLKPGSACSMRVNPGEGHGATNKTNTGGPSSKHGIYHDHIDEVKQVIKKYDLKLIGVHSHIGSEANLDHWLRIKNLTLDFAKQFDDIEFVDLGGGIPVVYRPTDKPMPLKEWGERLTESFTQFSREYGKDIQLQIEPGRFIAADSGVLVAEVQNLKHTPDYHFAIVNSGLNHNPRPAMYGSYHPIYFIGADGREMTGEREYVIGGNLCESGDVFTVEGDGTLAPRTFPLLQIGDLMVMGMVGAYTHSMKSEYNSMNLPASVLIDQDGNPRLIERRGTIDDIMRREVEAYQEGH